jgi:hypothetical protein
MFLEKSWFVDYWYEVMDFLEEETDTVTRYQHTNVRRSGWSSICLHFFQDVV